jgi:hypothetical protein
MNANQMPSRDYKDAYRIARIIDQRGYNEWTQEMGIPPVQTMLTALGYEDTKENRTVMRKILNQARVRNLDLIAEIKHARAVAVHMGKRYFFRNQLDLQTMKVFLKNIHSHS